MPTISTGMTAILCAVLLLSCGQGERVEIGDVRADQAVDVPIKTASPARRVDDPISRAPRVAAARMRREAARAAAHAAGVLPDPMLLPAGTKLECIGHFDNSKANPNNPEQGPSQHVPWAALH